MNRREGRERRESQPSSCKANGSKRPFAKEEEMSEEAEEAAAAAAGFIAAAEAEVGERLE